MIQKGIKGYGQMPGIIIVGSVYNVHRFLQFTYVSGHGKSSPGSVVLYYICHKK
jgi:hypothetical protein